VSPVTTIQIVMLMAAALAYALAAVAGLRHIRTRQADAGDAPTATLGSQARIAVAAGAGICGVLLIWRAATGSLHNPMATYFDAFLLLALILAGMLIYFRLTRHLRSFCIFLLPMIAAVLLIGGVLQLFSDRPFDAQSALTIGHIAAVMLGSACFAVSCVAGIIYLFADRQLRRRGGGENRLAGLPPLASIEKFNYRILLLGFPLLTIAMITGIFLTIARPTTMEVFAGWSKVLLAAMAWVIFGVLLLIRLIPAFRGRRAAQLSIVGFVVLICVFVAVTRVPHG